MPFICTACQSPFAPLRFAGVSDRQAAPTKAPTGTCYSCKNEKVKNGGACHLQTPDFIVDTDHVAAAHD